MAEEKTGKVILEREYIVPLRKKWLKTPEYKRVPKAIKTLQHFIARHMKVEERDLKKIKIDKWLNAEMWFRGIRKPYNKIKVKAMKLENGEVLVQLVEIPEALKWKIEKEKKLKEVGKLEEKKKEEVKEVEKFEEKKAEEAEKEKEEVKEEKKAEEAKKEEKEKEAATVESGLKQAEIKHREIKHEVAMKKIKKQPLQRKALQK